jgi:FdhD protein
VNSNSSVKKEITKYNDGSFERIEDDIAVEKRLRIFIKGKEVISFLCSPTMVMELVVGFVMSEGLFKGKGKLCPEQIIIEEGSSKNSDIDAHLFIEDEIEDHPATVTSGCAKGLSFLTDKQLVPIEDELKIRPEPVFDLFREFQKRSDLYRLTGGVHSSALSDGKEIIVFSEDIGRHNAVDKIIGYCLLNNITTKGKVLLSSGRLSSEIANKAVRAQIPVLVSRTAPTSMAVEIAEKNKLTIIGFLRGSRFTVYSFPERIIAP